VLDYRLWAKPWGLYWHGITFPVHIFQGDRDAIVPWHHAEDLAARLPNATVRRLDGEGHVSIQGRVGEILDAAMGPT
jgi:pimeloyl-ACP methyl ester carboxylesterase